MSIIGSNLGHYEITAPIGHGGMGEVYRAKDQKLGRDVAIKVLPEKFSSAADRVARFQREAKFLASLNHPNIAAIHELGESGKTQFLVLELVEGETLADRLKRGPIPVEQALKLALPIAEALEAAHEKGVIHRDLKPDNIKITPDGQVKILDFGLAKAFADEQEPRDLNLPDSPTLTNSATQQGVILGTAAYMSPEQARGNTVDKRTDIWAFGVVLFEMLTGKKLFVGETVSEILASVLKSEPEWKNLPPNIHSRIRLLLERCLEKESKNRYRDIGDPRVDIEMVLNNPSNGAVKPKAKKNRLVWFAATGLIALIVGLIAWNIRRPEESVRLRIPLDLSLPSSYSPSFRAPLVAISPDGRKVVCCSLSSNIKLFDLTEMDSSPVQLNSSFAASSVAFSPDGQWIMFLSALGEKSAAFQKTPVTGGTASMLWKGDLSSRGATWEKDGSLLLCQSGRISRIPKGKDKAETLLKLTEGEICGAPQMLPGDEWVLFSVTNEARPNPWASAQVVIQSLTSGERRILSNVGVSPRYIPTGHLAYVRGNNLFAVPFNLKTMRGRGEASLILAGVRTTDATADYDFSETGNLVYIAGGIVDTADKARPLSKLVVLDLKGKEISNPLSNESRDYRDFRLAPNGKQVAVTVNESSGNTTASHIWLYDIASGYGRQLTYGEGAKNRAPAWTVNGKRIVYLSDRNGGVEILRKAIDGSGKDDLLYQSKSAIDSLGVSVDGILIFGNLLASSGMRLHQADIWTIQSGSGGSPSKFMASTADVSLPRFSPNGKWVAYASDESGIPDVYVRPYPENDAGQKRISVGGGINPAWSSDGKALFYIAVDALPGKNARSHYLSSPRMMEVRVQTETNFTNKPPVELFKMDLFSEFDVTPGGDQFVLAKMEFFNRAKTSDIFSEERMRAYIVLNWFEELKKRAPVR
jgi:serine/threonine protein kinase